MRASLPVARAMIGAMLRRAIAISCLLAALAPATAVAAPADDLALALRFRPRLLFDEKERWRPIDVDRFLAEPGHLACPPVGAGPCAPLVSVGQLTPAVAYLASCAKTRPSLRECDGDGRSTIYAHVVRARTRIAIDYWWFLRYNAYSLDRHESDWEGVTVIVNRAATRLLAVHFAAHADVWRYDADVPQIVDGRVKVFLANGSHAAYPRRCTRLCRQSNPTLPEARFGGQVSWIGNSAAGCRRRCVRLLPTDAAGAPASWDAWDGRWGAPAAPAFAPPRTPAFQRRFADPFAAKHSRRHRFSLL
jgi:hypothetical protein